jgi:1-acyl-sn-glycerol-3-phosphate acyltransferase
VSLLDPEQDPLDLAFVERWAPVIELWSRYFRPTLVGAEHIPRQGPALLVGNHGLAAFDPFFLFLAIYRRTGRLPRGLGEHLLFTIRPLRDFWQKVGGMDGNQTNAVRFLEAGHLVNVYPGGAREALKGPDDLYRLRWEQSKGFIEVALRAQAPIIFHLGVGIDDSYRVLAKMRWTGRVMGSPKYDLPIWWGWGPLPRPVKITYHIAEPWHLDGSARDADDPAVVSRLHRSACERAQRLLDDCVKRRRSLWWG